MKTSNAIILEKLKATKNVVTRSSYESILQNRALRGDSEAMIMLINWLKWKQ